MFLHKHPMLQPPPADYAPEEVTRALAEAIAASEAAILSRRRFDTILAERQQWWQMIPQYSKEALKIIAQRGGDPDEE